MKPTIKHSRNIFALSGLPIFILACLMVVFSRVSAEPPKSSEKMLQKSIITEIDPTAISAYFKEGTERANALIEKWKIKSLREFNETASDKDITKFNEEFVALQKEITETGYQKLLKKNTLYTNPKGCAFVVTDMVSVPAQEAYQPDEAENTGENTTENATENTSQPAETPAAAYVTVALICEGKGNPAAGLTFVLKAPAELPEQFSKMNITIIGEVDTSMDKTPEEFRQYIEDGIIDGLILKVESLNGNTASWEPRLTIDPEAMSTPVPDYGSLTVYGTLEKPGQRVALTPKKPGN